MTSALSLCSTASLATLGLDVAVVGTLSLAALTQAAGPGSGTSLVVLNSMAQIKEL